MRREERADDVIRFDGWLLDTGRRRLVCPGGEDVALTSGEFDLPAALAVRAVGDVFTAKVER